MYMYSCDDAYNFGKKGTATHPNGLLPYHIQSKIMHVCLPLQIHLWFFIKGTTKQLCDQLVEVNQK